MSIFPSTRCIRRATTHRPRRAPSSISSWRCWRPDFAGDDGWLVDGQEFRRHAARAAAAQFYADQLPASAYYRCTIAVAYQLEAPLHAQLAIAGNQPGG